MRTVLTFGTFDVFHLGHLRILERARACGDRLVVGVSADQLNLVKKGRAPVFPEHARLRIVEALSVVDKVFIEESLELKRHYLLKEGAAILVMGDDWYGRFDEYGDICKVLYLERTPAISTTVVIESIVADYSSERGATADQLHIHSSIHTSSRSRDNINQSL